VGVVAAAAVVALLPTGMSPVLVGALVGAAGGAASGATGAALNGKNFGDVVSYVIPEK
jgi:hypothetical protein